MRRAALIAGLAVAAVAIAGPAAAMDHGTTGAGSGAGGGVLAEPDVPILFAAFKTPHIDVITGDTVHWSNDSARPHDVVSEDNSFDSGRIPVGASFEHRFDQPGPVRLLLLDPPLHDRRGRRAPVLLDAPTEHAGSGKPFVLTGRVAAGTTGAVAIEGDDGSRLPRRPARAAIADDGTFRTTVVPRATTTYRAVARRPAQPGRPAASCSTGRSGSRPRPTAARRCSP